MPGRTEIVERPERQGQKWDVWHDGHIVAFRYTREEADQALKRARRTTSRKKHKRRKQ